MSDNPLVNVLHRTLHELNNIPERQLGELSGRLAACKTLIINALEAPPPGPQCITCECSMPVACRDCTEGAIDAVRAPKTEMELSWFDQQMQDPKIKALFDIELAKHLAEHSVSYEKGWTDACTRVSDSIGLISMTPHRPTREDLETASMAVVRARRVVTEVSRSCPEVGENDE